MQRIIIAIALILMPLFTIISVGATDFSVNTTTQSLVAEIIEDDNTFNIRETRIRVAGGNAPASTTSETSPADITSADPLINANNINRNDYTYFIHIQERNANSAPAGSKWLVQFYNNGTQIGNDVYIGNTPAENSSEGIRIRVSLGSSFSGGVIEVVIKKIA